MYSCTRRFFWPSTEYIDLRVTITSRVPGVPSTSTSTQKMVLEYEYCTRVLHNWFRVKIKVLQQQLVKHFQLKSKHNWSSVANSGTGRLKPAIVVGSQSQSPWAYPTKPPLHCDAMMAPIPDRTLVWTRVFKEAWGWCTYNPIQVSLQGKSPHPFNVGLVCWKGLLRSEAVKPTCPFPPRSRTNSLQISITFLCRDFLLRIS